MDRARPRAAHGRRAPLGHRLRRRPADRAWDVELDEVVGTWPDDADAGRLVPPGLRRRSPPRWTPRPTDLECWTFLPAPSPLAMWARRQAHETAIHRVDAELAAGIAVSPFAPAFAADGVDELLTASCPAAPPKLRAEQPATLAVRCTDDDAAWLLRIGPDGVTDTAATTRRRAGADCSVRGAAADLYLALWNRAGPEGWSSRATRRPRPVPRHGPRALGLSRLSPSAVGLGHAGGGRRASRPPSPSCSASAATRQSRLGPAPPRPGGRRRSRQVSLTRIRWTTRTDERCTCLLVGRSAYRTSVHRRRHRRLLSRSAAVSRSAQSRRGRRRTRRGRSRPGRRGPRRGRRA